MSALYTILYTETFKPENCEQRTLNHFNRLLRISKLREYKSHLGHSIF